MEVRPPASKPEPAPPLEPLVDLKYRVCKRLSTEKRWREVEPVKDTLIREARDAGLGKEDAQRKAYNAIEQMFPPLMSPPTAATAPQPWEDLPGREYGDRTDGELTGQRNEGAASRTDGATERSSPDSRTRDSEAQVVGLGDLPPDWPRLPPNAPLAQEIQWVTANRLQVVMEVGDRCVVDLSRALTPAPSYAALGWLETSCRAYTKFVDVAAKATSQLEDEREHIRREKLAIEDVRKLLGVLQRLVDAGNTVIVIEHNLDVVKSADWVIDLGPGGGDAGGRIVATGAPEVVAQDPESVTGEFLRPLLGLAPAGGKRRRAKRSA